MDANLLRTVDVFLEGASQPLIVILGPTASGKTALSLEIAHSVGGEIVNADSRQLYAYLDIGTAKIEEKDMQGIPHHLLSLKDPKEEVSVGWYQTEARRVIDDILARGRIPLLVGGSMLYISSIIDGLTLAPKADPHLRASLERAYEEDQGLGLFQKLLEVDPETASSIHRHNKPYVVRALEIYASLKKTKSATVRELQCPYDSLLLGVEIARDELRKRIADRVDEMFASGWIEEVRHLLTRGYRSSDPGLQSHGYQEIVQYLEFLEHTSDFEPEITLQQLKQKIVAKTRQYAKRQLTWWRNDERIHWVHSPHPNFSLNVS